VNTIDLKRNFHLLIDSIENENLLSDFYDLLRERASEKEGQLWIRLSNQEQEALLNALGESENPENLIGHEEMKKKHDKWL
jgi:hypothetical protein